MANERGPAEYGPRLPPGLRVGDWRVVERHGQGSYGVIYRAVRADQEDAGPVALKLSVYPWDPRFAREAELLSRIRHPSVPRLLSQGVLRHASGAEYPWFAMEWVDGTPLYSWADQHALSSRQVLLFLAQVARALEATHSAQAVHRDVKGDNILVRLSDNRAVLIDFGSGHFQGAKRLTWRDLAPGTPTYRSPQASLFHIRSVRDRDAYYEATPADDVFALGVTAYRLVMGQYPPQLEPYEDEAGSWHVVSPDPRPFLERNPHVEPRLRELILRMLSDAPEARGSAAELAEALEAAADAPSVSCSTVSQLSEAHAPVAPPDTATPPSTPARPEHLESHSHAWAWTPWLALAAAGLAAILLWPSQPVHVPLEQASVSTQESSDSQAPDAGTAAVGDSPRPSSVPSSSKRKPVAQSPLPEPRPGQLRPDGKGRCQVRKQVALNGGCWVAVSPMTSEECLGSGYAYSQGKCYAPALAPSEKPVPTSSPPEKR
ncbi:MAG TPA: serine/threonine-protein kinase [Myxococcaceae bacterium]|jgi:serine/threonine protein kinase